MSRTCSREVFPPAVIDSVVSQMHDFVPTPELPQGLQLTTDMEQSNLKEAVLVELDDQLGESDVVRGEQALTLVVLATLYPEYFETVQIIGIVKEAIDGLEDFYYKYFDRKPIFVDQSYEFYRALGDRKVGLSELLNPVAILNLLCDGLARLRQKSIQGNLSSGEGIVQGGLILFDDKARPFAMYPEETGTDLRVTDVVTALHCLQQRRQQERQRDSSPTAIKSIPKRVGSGSANPSAGGEKNVAADVPLDMASNGAKEQAPAGEKTPAVEKAVSLDATTPTLHDDDESVRSFESERSVEV